MRLSRWSLLNHHPNYSRLQKQNLLLSSDPPPRSLGFPDVILRSGVISMEITIKLKTKLVR